MCFFGRQEDPWPKLTTRHWPYTWVGLRPELSWVDLAPEFSWVALTAELVLDPSYPELTLHLSRLYTWVGHSWPQTRVGPETGCRLHLGWPYMALHLRSHELALQCLTPEITWVDISHYFTWADRKLHENNWDGGHAANWVEGLRKLRPFSQRAIESFSKHISKQFKAGGGLWPIW
jgi:hypothetical protein